MHSYLKSIGFSNLVRKTDIDIILQDVIRHYDEKKVIETQDHRLMAELSRSYGCDVGITLCGEYDDEDNFHPEYYFPYFRGTGISTNSRLARLRPPSLLCLLYASFFHLSIVNKTLFIF